MKVSVIIAAHNAAETLAEALESLCAQTYTDWEAILIDDGSTDATPEIARGFADRDPRFRVIHQAQTGVSAARNVGISLARYDWLLFLDADDWILPPHLERMTHVLTQDDSLDAVYCGWTYITPDDHTVFTVHPSDVGDLFTLHAHECPFAIHAYVVRRAIVEAIGGFDPQLVVCEDWDLWQRFARFGARFGMIPHMLAPYRMRAGSASMDGSRIMADGLRVLQQAHASDPRVPRQHPVYPEGLPIEDLVARKFYLLCSAAGLIIGRNEDARFLLATLQNESCSSLEPYAVADCIVQAAMLSACAPLSEWGTVWQRLDPRVHAFLAAVEMHTGIPHLAYRARVISKCLIQTHMSSLSRRHFARALPARCLLFASVLKPGLRSHMPRVRWRLKQLVKNGLRVTPRLYRWACTLHRRYRTGENHAFFEALFAEQPDPWHYSTAYEQTKYAHTLDLLPDGPIETALELACAEGHFTVQLAPRVQHLLAADISQVALDRAAERCKAEGNVRFQRLDFIKQAIPGQFDLIVCSEVLYFVRHRKRLRAVARKLTRALKPGGHLIMTHGNVVIDEPDQPGFGWDHAFGAQGIGEVFGDMSSLVCEKELRTPLYRVQRFRRREVADIAASRHIPAIVQMDQPTPLPPEVDAQVFWHGSTEQLPILTYHRVAPAGSEALAPWRITPEAFEEQLCYLRNAGFRSVRLEDWGAWIDDRAPLPRGAICITFDDGYQDFLDYAWPLLQRYGFSASIYLVSDLIGRTNHWDQEYGDVIPLLNWCDIRRLQAEGVTFGSHSATHGLLISRPLWQVIRELRHSKDILEQGLGTSVNAIAYPYGEFNRVVQYLAGMCGYDFGLTCDPGPCTAQDSLLALPRIEVEGSDTLETFVAKLGSMAPRMCA